MSIETGDDPEHEAMLADSVGLALLVVLETLSPAERLAFVLHDMFGVPFEEIAPVVERTPAAARQLASRARRRVRGAAPSPDADLARQRRLVDAFLAAAREGDFDALVAVLDPEVVFRADRGRLAPHAPSVVTGGPAVAREAARARLALRAARAAGTGQRRRRGRRRTCRKARGSRGLHGCRRADRRDRPDREPRQAPRPLSS